LCKLTAERDKLESGKVLPGQGEGLTLDQYLRALQAGRTVCVEHLLETGMRGEIIRKTLVRIRDGSVQTQTALERVVNKDESEWRPGSWVSAEHIPLGNKCYIIESHETVTYIRASVGASGDTGPS
jgi:hypothetical protein